MHLMVDNNTLFSYVSNYNIIGYSVQWEEESTVVSCIHTLKDTSTDSEVS